MRPLEKGLRNELERTVKEARDVAEAAARAALEQLGVGEAEPFKHLSTEDRELRRKLRIHGRQLGDARNATTEVQEIDRLVEEVAYEHWHRMLFARFLAENNLLMYPDPADPVAVTLEECEDLAADEGAKNGWELASRFASKMLPQIFRPDSPVFQLTLPPEHQQKLERLIAGLSPAVFTASDSLGWVYQFWQSKRKDEVNASEVKIGARELPAVTQLFTEPYMVSFLLDNSLGAWWAARRLSETDLKTASSEEELRRKAALPDMPLDYLRFVKGEDGAWTPAAGTFDGWPKHLSELKTLDPCCGSGHFLVAAFLMLVPMRMELEGLSAREAVDAVLRENLHGLEIDRRCVELAAFALALTAWRYPDAGGYRALSELNVACSGLAVSVAKEEWKQLALGKHNLRIALDWMHDTFSDASVLGSLLNPTKTHAAKLEQWDELSSSLEQALKQEQTDEQQEAAVVAQGLAKAAMLLSRHYYWVITNVPYLARGKQTERLRVFCEENYPAGKNDLATVFLDRCLELCVKGGTSSVVLPQNWLFLTSYKKFREKLLNNDTWHLIARLGSHAFQTPMWDFNVQLIILSRGNITKLIGPLFKHTSAKKIIRGMDVSEPRTAGEKTARLLTAEIKSVEQAKQLANVGHAINFAEYSDSPMLSELVEVHYGSKPGQTVRVTRPFWEISKIFPYWRLLESTPEGVGGFTGKSWLILSLNEIENQHIKEFGLRSADVHGSRGFLLSKMNNLPISPYLGEMFDDNTYVVTCKGKYKELAIYSFLLSPDYREEVRTRNQKLAIDTNAMINVPFDLDHWTKVAKEKYPNGLPKPYSDDPTQWIFHGHPCGSVVWNEESKWTAHGPLRTDDIVLHVAVVRLLDYRWPAELDANMELADEQREWVNRCESLLPYADEDGIVCIPPVRGEASAADRLLNLLAAAYGDSWNNDKLSQLLKQADHAGKTLETWLRDKFFVQHCKLFHHRPFIWHIWDGLRDGFAALVNYHKLDTKLLETLIYTYLGDWISRQKQDITRGVDGAEEKLAAAENLKKRLELIREGEKPYDIFVRWKPIEKQPFGWEPDINDGVRLNIRPFLSVPDVGKKGAGVLREKPNIDWKKDRGQDVESAPWYPLFNGDRINDHHLSLEEKRKARSAKGNKA